jgi:hypothetical protein
VQAVENSPLTLGEKVLHNFGVQQEAYWYWAGIGAVFGLTVLFNVVYALSLTYLNRKQLHVRSSFQTLQWHDLTISHY